MTKTTFSLVLLTAAVFAPALSCRADAPALTVLHTFSAAGRDDLPPAHHANPDGAEPEAALMQGPDGTLYGTTASGGANGTGTIYKIGADGTGFAVLHSFGPLGTLFTNETNADGGRPTAALVLGKDGVLYGAAAMGGPKGSGTVFRIHRDGSGFAVLHAFEPKEELFHNRGGASPVGLTVAADGTLLGVASLGGDGRGLIFSLMPDGKNFRVLHSFEEPIYDGKANINKGGAIPSAAVALGPDGALYGTTNIGGSQGNGTLYRLSADGKKFAVLHTFRRKGGDYKSNGAFPSGPLTFGPDGFLYGCTRQGGEFDGGTAYKVSADGNVFTVLHTFSDPFADSSDGADPAGPPALGPGGYWYGVAGVGGENGLGTLFKINAAGTKFFVPHSFAALEGGGAGSGLTFGRDGSFYGVCPGGGANKSGTVFRVVLPKLQ